MNSMNPIARVLLGLLLLLAAVVPVQACPRCPEVKLCPLVIADGEALIEISEDSFSAYYFARTGRSIRKCLFSICSHRALEVAFNKLWGEGEIPERRDLFVTSHLLEPGSVYFFEMVAGKFELLLAGDIPVEDFSPENIFALSYYTTPKDFRFIITRLSSAESVKLKVATGVFPGEFLKLRQKMVFEYPAAPTREEVGRYTELRIELREKLITMQPGKLFEGLGRPFPWRWGLLAGGVGIAILSAKIIFRRK